MEFDVNVYNQNNRLQYKDAEELINKIKEENSDKCVFSIERKNSNFFFYKITNFCLSINQMIQTFILLFNSYIIFFINYIKKILIL